MAVVIINTVEVEPSRVPDFLADQRFNSDIEHSLGGVRSRRILRRRSGDNPGLTFIVMLEFDDWSGYQALIDGLAANSDFQAHAAATAADRGWRIVHGTFATEVEL